MSSKKYSVRRLLTFPAVHTYIYIHTVWHEESDVQVNFERALRLEELTIKKFEFRKLIIQLVVFLAMFV